MSKDSFYSKIT